MFFEDFVSAWGPTCPTGWFPAPAHSEALEVAAQRPAALLLLAGRLDALGEGEQLGGQQGAGPDQVVQEAHQVTRVLLRDEQHRLGQTSSACWGILGGGTEHTGLMEQAAQISNDSVIKVAIKYLNQINNVRIII